jgi:2-hydroxy-3-oxopropionate reductase
MRIGYLGLGNMGQPTAGKLLDAGHEVWVHDVRAFVPEEVAEGDHGCGDQDGAVST